jgi:hypothetical protein
LLETVAEEGGELCGLRDIEDEAGPQAGVDGGERRRGQTLAELGVAAKDDSEKGARVEAVAHHGLELDDDLIGKLLRLVDENHGTKQGGLDVSEPVFAQGLEAAPAVARGERHAEEVAHLSVEVGDAALGVADDDDAHVL